MGASAKKVLLFVPFLSPFWLDNYATTRYYHLVDHLVDHSVIQSVDQTVNPSVPVPVPVFHLYHRPHHRQNQLLPQNRWQLTKYL